MKFEWRGKSADGSEVILKKFNLENLKPPQYFDAHWIAAHPDLVRVGLVVDVETTGLSPEQNLVIEVGIRQFQFNRETGEVLSVGNSYCEFNDPNEPLSPEIIELTGITDADVKGKKIDWDHVEKLFANSHVVIAHNAAFDRPFFDRSVPSSRKKIWACSLNQVNWEKKGYRIRKLEILGIFHGFFHEAHRALSDVDSLLYLISLKDALIGLPYLKELLEQAKRATVKVIAAQAPFEMKDLLKSRRYRWDTKNRYWWIEVDAELLEPEKKWLESEIYKGLFRGNTIEIPAMDHFKGSQIADES
jgi:DNA polymerase-3 subunit epsilon